ncbi:hypothetical protein ACFW9W_28695, partial [Streptomyces sp. NPDC059468]
MSPRTNDDEAGEQPVSTGGDAASTPAASAPAPEAGPAGSDPEPGDRRVAAVRRFAATGRRWRALQLGSCAALLAVALTGAAIAVGAARDGGPAVAAASTAVDPGVLGSGNLDASIAALQVHLR